jgi:hypothetical protein
VLSFANESRHNVNAAIACFTSPASGLVKR